MKIFFKRLVGLFLLLFTLSFPFPHAFLPDIGSLLAAPFETLSYFIAVDVFQIERELLNTFQSDSVILYIHVAILFLLSALLSFALPYFIKRLQTINLKGLMIYLSYYLAAILFIYGMDKIFKHQFYMPEPNTLHTPIGDLSKDIAFWSIMGASRSYSIFSGIIEIIPALLLCFSRTRLVGALIAFMVLVNVLMLNIGFDISVKIFTLFLMTICLFILSFYWKTIWKIFFSLKDETIEKELPIKNLTRKIGAYLIPLLLLLNATYGFIKVGNYNDDTFPRPPYHGAYEVSLLKSNKIVGYEQEWKRVFIHRKNYLIVQLNNDQMIDFKCKFTSKDIIELEDYEGNKFPFTFTASKGELTRLNGKIRETTFDVQLQLKDWKVMELVKPQFHWTVD